MYGRNLRAYQKTSLSAELAVADPYTITKMLYQGIFEKLAQAKGAIERGDLKTKATTLSIATAILENLKSTLDFSYNKDLAQNLYDLYSFMIEKLADASIHLTTAPIDAVLRILKPIKEAWDSIPYSAVQKANQIRSTDDKFNSTYLASGKI